MPTPGTLSFAAAFMISLSYFLKLEISNLIDADRKTVLPEEEKLVYDFVIVGAGTSGCILAYRLSARYRVLLLESGPSPPSLVNIPAAYIVLGSTEEQLPINKIYKSVPQTAALNRVIKTSVGNMLGGSYSHNAMIFNRGSRYDLDNWSDILDDKSFSYRKMLKYFKRLENYSGDYPGRDHGTMGLLHIESDPQFAGDIWFAAGQELGYPRGDPSGVPADIFADNEVSRRKTLRVIRQAVVEKVEFSGKVANGVRYMRQGQHFKVQADCEVILTAGTLGTALILWMSGVGPRSMLNKAKIPVVEDLPVGQTLEDHPSVVLPFNNTDPQKFTHLEQLTEKDLLQYLNRQPERILSTTGVGPQSFITSSSANSYKGKIWPDLQLVLDNSKIAITNSRPALDNLTIGKVELDVNAFKNGERQPEKLLLIDYKLGQNQRVNTALLEGLNIAKRIIETKAFKAVGAEITVLEACRAGNNLWSHAYWKCIIRNVVYVNRHPVGTCRMSKLRQKGVGVVDTRFRLRVADGSVMPKIPNANTNAIVAAVAEKAAAVILKDSRIINN